MCNSQLWASTRLVTEQLPNNLATDWPVHRRMFLYYWDNSKNVNIYYNKEENLFVYEMCWLLLQHNVLKFYRNKLQYTHMLKEEGIHWSSPLPFLN